MLMLRTVRKVFRSDTFAVPLVLQGSGQVLTMTEVCPRATECSWASY